MMIKQYENSKIIASLVKAFAEVKQATRSEINPYFKSKYADLSEIDNACRDALVNNKLSIMQIPKYRGENVLEIQMIGVAYAVEHRYADEIIEGVLDLLET